MFQLSKKELGELNWFQTETSSDKRKHSSTLPYAFTEQGVVLTTVLKMRKQIRQLKYIIIH